MKLPTHSENFVRIAREIRRKGVCFFSTFCKRYSFVGFRIILASTHDGEIWRGVNRLHAKFHHRRAMCPPCTAKKAPK